MESESTSSLCTYNFYGIYQNVMHQYWNVVCAIFVILVSVSPDCESTVYWVDCLRS